MRPRARGPADRRGARGAVGEPVRQDPEPRGAERPAELRARARAWLLARSPEALEAPSRWERRVRVREAVARFLLEDGLPLGERETARLVRELSDEITGLGPLEPLLRDPSVTEVMVNGPDRVYVERAGRIEPAGVRLDDAAAVRHLIDRIVAPLGLRVDESAPWVDARLPDGSRVHAIVPPLALTGPTLTIRKFPASPMAEGDLVALGSLTPATAALLREAVRARRNLIVSGGTGAGKTTLLNVLSAHIPGGERIVTIEDAAELRLAQEHVVALEARPPNVEGRGAVAIRDLVRNALRMRPDRIVVGEVRGAEALDMLQAMNTGHDGSMSTAHANSPRDLIVRLEAMALMGAAEVPAAAVRRMIGAALDLVVHVARGQDGVRRVVEVAEVHARGDEIETHPLLSEEPACAG
ncbi:MAG: CpaF family protein [Acidobacteria bacterium]|nr:CpaF family protein [Acidobacteriota bacterium]